MRIFVILELIPYYFTMKVFNFHLIFLGLVLLQSPSYAEISSKNFGNIQLHIGNWLEYPGQIRNSRQGSTNGFEFSPYIASSLEYNLPNSFQIIPELGHIIQRTNDKITKNQFFIRADLAYAIFDYLKFRLGSSFMILNLSSDGSEIELNNENTTQTYFRPNESHTIFNQTLDFGIEYLVKQHSLKLQSYTYAWNENEQRLTSFSLAYTYAIAMDSIL